MAGSTFQTNPYDLYKLLEVGPKRAHHMMAATRRCALLQYGLSIGDTCQGRGDIGARRWELAQS